MALELETTTLITNDQTLLSGDDEFLQLTTSQLDFGLDDNPTDDDDFEAQMEAMMGGGNSINFREDQPIVFHPMESEGIVATALKNLAKNPNQTQQVRAAVRASATGGGCGGHGSSSSSSHPEKENSHAHCKSCGGEFDNYSNCKKCGRHS